MAKRKLVSDSDIFPYLCNAKRYVAVKLNIGIATNMEVGAKMSETKISDELSPVWIVFDKGEGSERLMQDRIGEISESIDDKEMKEKLLKLGKDMVNEMIAKMLVKNMLEEIVE